MVDFIMSSTGQIVCVLVGIAALALYIGVIVFEYKWGGHDRDNR